ncbi:hypothetical protein Bca101_072131 [Brassica carinata]
MHLTKQLTKRKGRSKPSLEKGTNTRDRFELRVHKHVIGLFCSPDVVKQITSITIEADVEGKGQRY